MVNFDLETFKSISEKVFNCDSPSGYSINIVKAKLFFFIFHLNPPSLI